MSRRICFSLAATFALIGCNLAYGQDAQQNNNPAASPAAAAAPAGDNLAQLQTENAALKKQVADAGRTIAKLQAELAKAGIHHQAATDAANPDDASTATDNSAPSTNAAPTGPLKALPLDAPNPALEHPQPAPGAPATDAGPSRSYTVVKGDSLWKIAHKMYPGDTKNGVDKIQEANKDALGTKPLKIGQVLIIPQ